jgi:hypothetical protein
VESSVRWCGGLQRSGHRPRRRKRAQTKRVVRTLLAAVRGGDAMVPLKHDGVCDFGREVMCGGGGLSCAASACAVSLWRCQTARPVPRVVIALDCVGMRAMMLTAHTRSCQLPSLVLASQPRPCAVRGHRLPGHTGLWGDTDRWPRPFTASPSCAAQTNTNKHTRPLPPRAHTGRAWPPHSGALHDGTAVSAVLCWQCGWRSGTAAVLRHWDGAGGYCALTVLCSTLTGAGGRGMPWSAASH